MLSLAALAALMITEFMVGTLFGFPAYGVRYKVRYRNGAETWTNVRKAHAEIYNVEGDVKTQYNNYGLPGLDMTSLEKSIVVLGSSFVEALQSEPEKIATSVFQRNLQRQGISKQVINLGCSGHDPYDSWFRLQYYEQALGISTEEVILVINSDNTAWLSRHPKPLRFEKFTGFGDINRAPKTRYMILARNSLSIVELFASSLKSGRTENRSDKTLSEVGGKRVLNGGTLTPEFVDVLDAFNTEYEDFQVISIVNLPEFNRSLAEYCAKKDIPCQLEVLLKPDLRIDMSGHLNERGNVELGNALTRLYYKDKTQKGVEPNGLFRKN